jgi:hypothetical protein
MHQRRALVLIAILTAGVGASAQTLHRGHGTKATCKDTPASKAFREVVLTYGKDDETRKWANDSIRDQRREIAEMQAWFTKKGP